MNDYYSKLLDDEVLEFEFIQENLDKFGFLTIIDKFDVDFCIKLYGGEDLLRRRFCKSLFYSSLTSDLIKKFPDFVDWTEIYIHCRDIVDDELLKSNFAKIEKCVFSSTILDISFIEKFSEQFVDLKLLHLIDVNEFDREKIIEKHLGLVDWKYASSHLMNKLSLGFILKYSKEFLKFLDRDYFGMIVGDLYSKKHPDMVFDKDQILKLFI